MKLITAPITPTSAPDGIANLQEALLFLLQSPAITLGEADRRALQAAVEAERPRNLFGPRTTKALNVLQEILHLAQTGQVDEATADEFNRLLRAAGGFDERAPRDFVVSGRVTGADGAPLSAVEVRAFHVTDAAAIRLGEDTTDTEGRYTIRYDTLSDTPAILLRVAVSRGGTPIASSNVVRGAKPLEVIDLAVSLTTTPGAKHRIEGRVLFEHGLPAVGITLRLYRHAFGGAAPTAVQDSTTGEQGLYRFEYDADDKSNSLEIRAVDAAGVETPLTEILHGLGAEGVAYLNLAAPDALKPLAAEFARMAADFTPHFGDMKTLSTAVENEKRQDFTLLNAATGWDARLIALASKAARVSADPQVGLSQPVLYGLFRAGLPSDTLQLAQVSTDIVGQALDKAKQAGIVDLSDPDIREAKTKFAELQQKVRLSVEVPGAAATYDSLLAAAELSAGAREKFVDVYLNHRGPSEELWSKAAAAGVGAADIEKLQQQGKLTFLTRSEPMTLHLQKSLAVSDPVQLVDKGLYQASRWKAEAETIAAGDAEKLKALIPPSYRTESVDESIKLYTEDMARKVRLSYPTQVVAHQIEEDSLDEFRLGDARDGAATLLKAAAAKGFTLGETPVDAFLRLNPDVIAKVGAAAADPVTREAVKTLQRVYQMTPSDAAMPALLKLGFTSAFDVVALTQDEFLERHGDAFPSREQARLVYRKAQQVSSVTHNLFTIARKIDSDPQLHGVSATTGVRDSVKQELIKQFPTMESLFGSMDYCECEHCRSVLSPAAYLVDLLQFIDADAPVWNSFLSDWKKRHGGVEYTAEHKKPYDALIERRPDLPYIALTCENTHTALPYIDVVNEILEYYVAHGKLEEKTARNTSDVTTAELLAEPQNVMTEAYETLQRATYPLNLPFDLWLETVRRFTSYFETPLAHVLETFRPGDELLMPERGYDRAAIAFEILGLSPAETALFTTPDPLAEWYALYGYTKEADALEPAEDRDTRQRLDLNAAKALSRRLGITYKELVEILQTGFVNPDLAGLAVLHKLRVSVHDVLFYSLHQKDYDRDKDLLGADRRALAAADQVRYDALDRGDWEALAEVAGLEKRLTALSEEYASWLFDAAGWLKDALSRKAFDNVLVLSDPQAALDFDRAMLVYGFRAAKDKRAADPIAFLRINLFVRLWRTLGWSIDDTDRALRVCIPRDETFSADTVAKTPLKAALITLARIKTLDARLNLGKQGRPKLLTLWSLLSTDGRKPLYAQLFLQPGRDAVFNDPLGRYLSAESLKALAAHRTHRVFLEEVPATDEINAAAVAGHPKVRVSYDAVQQVQHLSYEGVLTDAEKATLTPLSASPAWPKLLDAVQRRAADLLLIKGHMPALQGALSLSADEIDRILRDDGQSLDSALLSLENVSLLYRYGLLARALKMSVGDLVILKALTGLKPFHPPHATSMAALAEDHLWTQTLAFVEIAAQVKDSGLQMADLDYLLRHRFEATGKYQPTADALSALVQSLADGIGAIHVEHALPDAPGVVTDDLLRQKLGLVLPSDVVDRTVRMLDGNAAAEARTVFDTYLVKQKVKADDDAGALEAADFDPLFGSLTALKEILASDTEAQIAAKETANETITKDNQATLEGRRHRIAAAFLPVVRRRLIRELVAQMLAAHFAAEGPLVEALLTDPTLLHHGDASDAEPLIGPLTRAGVRGITIRYFNASDASGAPDTEPVVVETADSGVRREGRALRPAAAKSARFEGYLQAQVSGSYRFYVSFDQPGQQAEMLVPEKPDWVLTGTASAGALEIDSVLELQAGIPYQFSLTLRQLGGGDARLLVQAETLPKGALGRLTLRPAGSWAHANQALTVMSKTMQLLQALNVTGREMRYVAAHADRFEDLSFSALPTTEQEDGQALFGQVRRLMAYSRLKRDMAGGTAGLIDLFETKTDDAAYARVAAMTRRDGRTVKAVARALGLGPRFEDERSVRRLEDALAVVDRLGVPVGAILSWTRIVSPTAGSAERATIAQDLREAVKARFDAETWQRVAQPIFDALRQRKRDALVAHVMHQHRFDRLEQMYEYFLVDPGMEPAVLTSRIRLATSSVQLFIQRSLLNLEKRVHPSAIKARQWEWMKAYRVWEANRKIFLFPENWLEPEFRDDKTHLFRELEGSLLQGDVSNDLVEDALLQYLRKLNELARLEIVAMHLEDKPDATLNTLHVIGRTYSEPHKYFYRRYADQMWTPWEPINADISGDHLAPVIWKERLFLFWITFMEVPPRNEPPSGGDGIVIADLYPSIVFGAGGRLLEMGGKPEKPPTLTEMTLGQLTDGVQSSVPRTVDIQVQVHWSEHAKGEWSTRESGGVGASFVATVPFGFTPQAVGVHVSKDVEGDEDRAVYVHLGGPIRRAFKLAGRNSAPVAVTAGSAPLNPYTAKEVSATRLAGSGPLKVTLNRRITVTDGTAVPTTEVLPVIEPAEPFTVLACDNEIGLATPEIASLIKPLFYQDSSHTYYLEPNLEERTIEEWRDWVVQTPQPDVGSSLPIWPDPIKYIPELPQFVAVDPGNPIWNRPISSGSMYKLEGAKHDWIVNPGTGVIFDGEVIGATGRAGLAVLSKTASAQAVQQGAVRVDVQAGSELPADAGVFQLGGRIAEQRHELVVVTPPEGMTLVGDGGLHQALEQNVGRLNQFTGISNAGRIGRIVR